jgi:uncharacterized protein YjdB
MRVKMRRVLALVMALVLVVSMTPVSTVSAAAKPKLNKTKATVIAGESISLSIKNASKGCKVTWSSGAKKVATVSRKGKVTGVKAGKAKITAKVKTNGKS